jgi:hypothetical protein
LDTYKRYSAAFKHSLQDIDALMALIHDLNKNYQFVDEKSKDIQMACERLLEEQVIVMVFNDRWFWPIHLKN